MPPESPDAPIRRERLAADRFRYWISRGHRPGLAAKMANREAGVKLTSLQYQELAAGYPSGAGQLSAQEDERHAAVPALSLADGKQRPAGKSEPPAREPD